jgi:hypothetical protein
MAEEDENYLHDKYTPVYEVSTKRMCCMFVLNFLFIRPCLLFLLLCFLIVFTFIFRIMWQCEVLFNMRVDQILATVMTHTVIDIYF